MAQYRVKKGRRFSSFKLVDGINKKTGEAIQYRTRHVFNEGEIVPELTDNQKATLGDTFDIILDSPAEREEQEVEEKEPQVS